VILQLQPFTDLPAAVAQEIDVALQGIERSHG
jgi:hypothetical protein